jgi:hypothetical protein
VIYSVLNQRTRLYDYYETGEAEPWHAPAPPAARHPSALGATPDAAAWPLPAGARKIGAGENARGRIAVSRSAALGMGDVEPAVMVAGTIAAMIAGLALLTKASR